MPGSEFLFDAFKKNSPFYGAYYGHVTKVEKTGERDITFHKPLAAAAHACG